MADSKKYNGSTWEHSLRKLTTSTDTLTTLPADIYADGNNATVGISGNTVQSGTPTPQNPIIPRGCGERTGNLFDYSAITTGYRIQWTNGAPYADDTAIMSDYIPVTEDDYTLNISSIIIGYAADKSYIGVYRSEETWEKLPSDPISSFTVLNNTNVEFVRLLTYGIYSPITDALMLNEGSTPLPYEPYGQYKIPISSANTTTPVYLGEVETTRQIKKLVLTGDENTFVYNGLGYIRLSDGLGETIAPYSDKLLGTDTVTASMPAFSIRQDLSDITPARLTIKADFNFTSNDVFKSWLAKNQITVWYVLATETTGIVNEPLMRIGDYADTVSGITIPTIISKDTFDVDTTLKPSEVSLSYTGWHDASVKEKSRNLFDYVSYFDSVFTPYNEFFNYSSIQLLPNTTYTLSTSIAEYGTNPRNTAFIVATTNQTPTAVGGGISNISPITITTENDGMLKLYKRISGNGILPTKDLFDAGDWLMLNTGSTALPYESYWK